MKRFVFVMVVLLLAMLPVLAQQDRGDRLLGVHGTEAEGEPYETVFAIGCDIGMQTVVLLQDWTDFEAIPEQFQSDIPAIANLFYPRYDMPLDFMIAPVNTNTLRLPADLMGLPLDDRRVIDRFNTMLDWVFDQMPDITFSSLSIGSEIDIYLGSDRERWQQYSRFAAAVRAHIRARYPDVPIGFEMTVPGLTGETADYAQSLNEWADVIGVSYYPLNPDSTVQDPSVVHDTFAELVALYPDKPLRFYQLGYPSSEQLNSSEANQAQFIREVFSAWDTYAEHIAMIDFTWLSDLSAESVAFFEDYYGFQSEPFAQLLGSLGFRDSKGKPKLALQTLTDEASARGWGHSCRI